MRNYRKKKRGARQGLFRFDQIIAGIYSLLQCGLVFCIYLGEGSHGTRGDGEGLYSHVVEGVSGQGRPILSDFALQAPSTIFCAYVFPGWLFSPELIWLHAFLHRICVWLCRRPIRPLARGVGRGAAGYYSVE